MNEIDMKNTYMKIVNLFIFILFGGVGPAFTQGVPSQVLELAALMEGNFSTARQSGIDTTYFNIRLHMKRIWPERDDAVWFYVEQVAASTPEKPYRQRVYKLTEAGYNLFESAIFEITDPLRFVGEWKSPDAGKSIDPENLKQMEGCSVFLKKIGENKYSGSTDADKCKSDWRGAKYVSSIVNVLKDGLITWDRGFDENGKYLWGAEKAGYFFARE